MSKAALEKVELASVRNDAAAQKECVVFLCHSRGAEKDVLWRSALSLSFYSVWDPQSVG